MATTCDGALIICRGVLRGEGRCPQQPAVRYDAAILRIVLLRDARVREKELRIALVCFGGVSLAVYMHGITKEILKLARASSAVHGITDRAKRRLAGFFDRYDEKDPEYD